MRRREEGGRSLCVCGKGVAAGGRREEEVIEKQWTVISFCWCGDGAGTGTQTFFWGVAFAGTIIRLGRRRSRYPQADHGRAQLHTKKSKQGGCAGGLVLQREWDEVRRGQDGEVTGRRARGGKGGKATLSYFDTHFFILLEDWT